MRGGRSGAAASRADPGSATPELEPGEVPCQLILPGPSRLEADIPALLGRALAGGRVAAVLLDPAAWTGPERGTILAACRDVCRAHTAALFLTDDPAAVIETAADGVLLRAVEAVAPARRLLGLERPIGVATGGSRHAAMEAGEAGADWLLLGEGLSLERCVELVGWWSAIFTLPAAAPCPDPEAAAALVAAGADFLIPPASIWSAPEAALAPFRAALGTD